MRGGKINKLSHNIINRFGIRNTTMGRVQLITNVHKLFYKTCSKPLVRARSGSREGGREHKKELEGVIDCKELL